MTSLRTSSAARLGATLARAAIAFVATTVTARVLGPSDKGTLSSLLFVVMLGSYVTSLGLGDAAIVLTRSGRASVRDACSATLPATALASVVGMGVLGLVGFGAGWWRFDGAMVAALAMLPVATAAYVLGGLTAARGQLLRTSAALTAASVVDVLAIVVLVGLLELGITGGVVAGFAGMAAAVAVLLPPLRRDGLLARPTLDRSYLGPALRFGAVNESAFVLVALAQRADVLLVYALAGAGDAGRYSVAMSISQLAAQAAGAVGYSAFPELASLAADDARTYVTRVCRLALAATVVSGVALAIAVPIVVPLLFGPGFDGTVGPTLLLVLSAAPWAFLAVVSRAAAASGEPRVRLAIYGASVAAMLGMDLVTVPSLGLAGAALGYLASLLVGCVVAARWLRARHDLSTQALLPRWSDGVELAAMVRDAARGRRRVEVG